MNAGRTIEEVTTRVGREHGRLVTMVTKKQLSRETLRQISDELDELARLIRTVTNDRRDT